MLVRIVIAAAAVAIAAVMAVQLYEHWRLDGAVAELRHEIGGVNDPSANRRALERAESVADVRPGTGALFVMVGLDVRAHRLAAAERTAQRAVHREPDNFATWLTLGVIRQQRGDRAGAAAAYARVKALNPLYRTPR